MKVFWKQHAQGNHLSLLSPVSPPKFNNLQYLYPFPIWSTSLSDNDRFSFHNQHLLSPPGYQFCEDDVVTVSYQECAETDGGDNIMLDACLCIGEGRPRGWRYEHTHYHKGACTAIKEISHCVRPKRQAITERVELTCI